MTGRYVKMKRTFRSGSVRILLLSALLTAVLTCTAVLLAAGAAGNAVTPSDTVSASVVTRGGAEPDRMLFRPDAVYNGNYRDELTNDEKKLYDAFVRHVLTDQSTETLTVDVSAMRCLKSDSHYVHNVATIAYHAFEMDHPEACWYRTGSTRTTDDGVFVKNLCIDPYEGFTGSFGQRQALCSSIDTAVGRIRQSRASESRYDTVRAIHDYICDRATYAYNHEESSTNAAPVFGFGNSQGKIVCAGYADAFKILCDRLGVPAAVVVSEIHAYNYVLMEDGCYYAVDCTWDDSEDSTPPSYRYFLVGSSTAVSNDTRFCDEYDHREYGYFMQGEHDPIVFPPLADTAYTPDGGALFWDDCGEENRTVSGVTSFTWKYKGDPTQAGALTVTLERYGSTCGTIGTFRFDGDGLVTVTYDTTRLKYDWYQVVAQVGDVKVTRTIRVKNTQFELLNWPGDNPVLSDPFDLQVKGYSTVDVTRCSLEAWIDSRSVLISAFPSGGVLTIPIDTSRYGNGYHELILEYTNSYGEEIRVSRSFQVYHPSSPFNGFAFWGESAEEGRLVGEMARFMLKYDGTATDACTLSITVDGAAVPFYTPYAAGMGDFFDASGVGLFIADISRLTNGAHTVQAAFVAENGSRMTASVGSQVTDGYFTFENWPGDNPIVTRSLNYSIRNISGEPNGQCNLYILHPDGVPGYPFYFDDSGLAGEFSIYVSDSSEGQYWSVYRFVTSSGTVVEKIKRYRVKKDAAQADDSFGFSGDSMQDNRLVGEYADFRLHYGGSSPEDCRLNVTLDGTPVTFYPLVEGNFDSSGDCVFFVDVRNKANGAHSIKVTLTRPDGSTLQDERTIVVTDAYFRVENWPSENTVVTGDYSYTVRNISGEAGDRCSLEILTDGEERTGGGNFFGNDNTVEYYCTPGASIRDGVHWRTFYVELPSGVKVWKSLRLTYRYAQRPKVPQFSFTTLGASIRLSDPYGIRFGIRIDKNEDFNQANIVEYGTLIIGSGTLGDRELTYYTDSVRRIKAVNLLENDSTHITYTGVLIGIPKSFFGTNVKGRGYLIYKDSLGECHIVYSETVEKSFYGVAEAAYESYSRISHPTAAQQAALDKLRAILADR